MTKQLSIAECSRLAGVARNTIYAKIKSGELSQLNNKKIDLSELLRVYPFISIEQSEQDNKKQKVLIDAQSVQIKIAQAVQLADQKSEIRILQQRVEHLEQTVQLLQIDKADLMGLAKQNSARITDQSRGWQFWKIK